MTSGVVFGLVKGNHGGIVHLKSPNGLLKLRYRDSDYSQTSAPAAPPPPAKGKKGAKAAPTPVPATISGLSYGAFWRVVYKKDEISKILYAGMVYPPVVAADQLVRKHYQLLGAHKWERAYKDLGAAWRQQQSLHDFIEEQKKARLGWAAKNPSSYALLVTSASPKEVQEVIYIGELQEYYRYTLVKAGKGLWQIDHVDQITKADYDKA